VILVREDLATTDIAALEATTGLLAVHGARTSHAAVLARQLGKACIVGCTGLAIDADGHAGQFGAQRIAEGEMLTLDAASGCVYPGSLPVVRTPPHELLGRLNALGA